MSTDNEDNANAIIVESREETQEENQPPKPRINVLNYVNLVAYLLNVLVTFTYGTDDSVSDTNQAIVTPSGWAFSIWGLIFTFQGLFTLAQFLPRFRSTPIVQKGVYFWYAFACVFQASWVFAFNNEVIWLSVILILLIWASLLALVVSQYYVEPDGSLLEYWLIRFPFSIHCAWVTAASLLNINVLIVDLNANASIQLATGILALAILHAVAVVALFALDRPNYVFPAVFSWATGAIAAELSSPKQSIINLFDSDIITGVRYASAAVSVIILIHIATRLLMTLIKKYRVRSSDSINDETVAEKNSVNEGQTGLPEDVETAHGKEEMVLA